MPLKLKRAAGGWDVLGTAGGVVGPVGQPGPPGPSDYPIGTTMVPIAAGTFPTWVNQGTATVQELGGTVFMYVPGTGFPDHFHGRVKPLGAISRATFAWLSTCGIGMNEQGTGIAIGEAATDKWLVLWSPMGQSRAVTIWKYTTPAAGPVAGVTYAPESPYSSDWISNIWWGRFIFTATQYTIHWSLDGLAWQNIFTENKNSFFTVGPDRIGLVAMSTAQNFPVWTTFCSYLEE